MRDRQGFILVYDITNPVSVDDLNDLYIQILQNKTTSDSNTDNPIPLVLVGNKLDLANERKVSHQRGKDLSERWRCPHYETSAKTRINVDEVFYDLVGQIIANKEEAVRSRKASGAPVVSHLALEKHDSDGDYTPMACCTIS
jgi:GTPase SAR1 family protein